MRGQAGPGRLRHRVGEVIASRGLWAPGDRVAVAVSGGLDSVVLLDVLHQTVDWHGAQLEVVTIDHGTRETSPADAVFVAELAASLGLPCATHTLSLGPAASEAVARAARYAIFEALDVDRVALAHHRDDQAETLLLHLLRGAGTRGLGAMRAVRGRYVRPFLEEPRLALAAWAAHRGLKWREDDSNQDPRFLRNRIRAEVVPLLESLRPGASAALARSAALCRADDDWLEALVGADPMASEASWPCEWVVSAPRALVGRVLLRKLPSGASAAHIDALIGIARAGQGRVLLPGGTAMEVRKGKLVIGV